MVELSSSRHNSTIPLNTKSRGVSPALGVGTTVSWSFTGGRESPVINFSLLLVPESTISLDGLWTTALLAVTDQLRDCGYTIEQADAAEAAGEHGLLQKYRLKPDLATLTAATNATGSSIQFLLGGDKFGRKTAADDHKDPVVWMRLVTLGVHYNEAYTVVPNVSDPDFATGAAGSPAPFLSA